jgi:ectoine hydroxylase-related dioxygenase (phytanoyl-CoA dioxygenase family)
MHNASVESTQANVAWQMHPVTPSAQPMRERSQMTIRDLGLVEEPVSNLFAQPRSRAEWEPYILSAGQVAHFHEHGFVAGIRILNDAQVEVLRDELAELTDPAHPGNSLFYEYHSNEAVDPGSVLFHALGAWRVTPGFHDLLWAPAYRMAAYQLLGAPFRQFHDQLFCKPAGHGGVVAWHQDYSYWTWTAPMAHLTCWLGLDDVDESNGCLHYVPGSHRWGLLPVTGLAGEMDAVRELLDDEQARAFDAKVPIILNRGECAFHHPLTMHGSYANRSNRPRRATVLNVFADGVISNPQGLHMPGSGNYPKVPDGQPMSGDYFPLLWDPTMDVSGIPSIHDHK